MENGNKEKKQPKKSAGMSFTTWMFIICICGGGVSMQQRWVRKNREEARQNMQKQLRKEWNLKPSRIRNYSTTDYSTPDYSTPDYSTPEMLTAGKYSIQIVQMEIHQMNWTKERGSFNWDPMGDAPDPFVNIHVWRNDKWNLVGSSPREKNTYKPTCGGLNGQEFSVRRGDSIGIVVYDEDFSDHDLIGQVVVPVEKLGSPNKVISLPTANTRFKVLKVKFVPQR